MTVNSDADLQARIIVSKDTFGTQSALTLGVAESSREIPADLGKTTKAFDLSAVMGGNTVSVFEKSVKIVMGFDLPSGADNIFAYCLDDGTRIAATYDA